MTPHQLLFHAIAFLVMTVAPVSLSMRLPTIVDRLTHRAGDRLLNPVTAYLTATQMCVAAHGASRGNVSKWAKNIALLFYRSPRI